MKAKKCKVELLKEYQAVFQEISRGIMSDAVPMENRCNLYMNTACVETLRRISSALDGVEKEAEASDCHRMFIEWNKKPWDTEDGEKPDSVKDGERLNDELLSREVLFFPLKFKHSKLPGGTYISDSLSVALFRYIVTFDALED